MIAVRGAKIGLGEKRKYSEKSVYFQGKMDNYGHNKMIKDPGDLSSREQQEDIVEAEKQAFVKSMKNMLNSFENDQSKRQFH